jgi:hypothetical protein
MHDTNGDGKITFEEFCAVRRRGGRGRLHVLRLLQIVEQTNAHKKLVLGHI